MAHSLYAQMAPGLSVSPVPMVKAAKDSVTVVSLNASLPAGYHANSNKPTEAYLIPLTLKWNSGPLDVESIGYPTGKLEKYSFSDKPLSVVTGEFTITTKFRVKQGASSGPAQEIGTLRYQACDNHACYPPKNVAVNVTVEVQ
jgi:hypothetical protein